MARLTWNGDRIAAKALAASQLGVDRTMSACVDLAKRNHPWINQTGFEEGTITILEGGAMIDGLSVIGRWGALGAYSIFLEIGTSRVGITAFEREQAAQGNMWAVDAPEFPPGVVGIGWGGWGHPPDPNRPREGPLMAPRPFLRPAADREYRLLRVRIGAAFRGQEMP